jgi:hypothetical protein
MVIADGQLIWMRYNAMLAANAFGSALLGALLLKDNLAKTHQWLLLLASAFGVLLVWQWRGLTKRGWELQRIWVYEAKKHHWHGYKTAFEAYADWRARTGRIDRARDLIEIYAHRVIILFLLAYIFIFLIAIWLLLEIGDPLAIFNRGIATMGI